MSPLPRHGYDFLHYHTHHLHICEWKHARAFPYIYSELHQLPDAGQDVSSSEEEELQVHLLPAGGVSSREFVRIAMTERGHGWDTYVSL